MVEFLLLPQFDGVEGCGVPIQYTVCIPLHIRSSLSNENWEYHASHCHTLDWHRSCENDRVLPKRGMNLGNQRDTSSM